MIGDTIVASDCNVNNWGYIYKSVNKLALLNLYFWRIWFARRFCSIRGAIQRYHMLKKLTSWSRFKLQRWKSHSSLHSGIQKKLIKIICCFILHQLLWYERIKLQKLYRWLNQLDKKCKNKCEINFVSWNQDVQTCWQLQNLNCFKQWNITTMS